MSKRQSNPPPPCEPPPYPGCMPPSPRLPNPAINRELLNIINEVKEINSRLNRMDRDIDKLKLKVGLFT